MVEEAGREIRLFSFSRKKWTQLLRVSQNSSTFAAKQKYKTMAKEEKKQYCTRFKVAALILAGVATIMLVVAFLMPPPWEIHQSVLAAVGEFIGIIALFMGWEAIDRGIDAKISHGNTTIELNNPDNEQKDESK